MHEVYIKTFFFRLLLISMCSLQSCTQTLALYEKLQSTSQGSCTTEILQLVISRLQKQPQLNPDQEAKVGEK